MNTPRFALIYALGSGIIGLAELIIGWMTGSLALIADSIHSITDVVSGLVSALASKIAAKEPDRNHPFGHSRAEPLGAFFVAVITALLGLDVIQMAIRSLIERKTPEHSAASIAVVLLVLAFKLGFYAYGRLKGTSPIARALTLDSRNDALATFGTLTVILLSYWHLPYLDSIFAIVIGGFILYSGFQIGLDNISLLMGNVPPNTFFERVSDELEKVSEVRAFHRLKAHHVGPDIHLALTVQLDPHMSLEEAHEVEHDLVTILTQIPDLTEVFVHIEPYQMECTHCSLHKLDIPPKAK